MFIATVHEVTKGQLATQMKGDIKVSMSLYKLSS